MSEYLIRTTNLKKYFKNPAGYLHAVDGIDLSIKKGTTLGIVGESGCGKSTLGRALVRLIESEGEIFYEDQDILKLSANQMRKLRRKMQMIFQDPYSSINPRMTVSTLIEEAMISNRLYKSKREREKRIVELMEIVGLSERLYNAYPHELDGGRRQRIGIARALSVDPKFIVCDEPVSALDVSIQAQILNLLMDLQEKFNLTYVFITHDLSVVKHISDEIAVMYLGQCVEKAPKNELFKNPMHPYTKALLSAIPVPSLKNRGKKREIIKGEVVSPIKPKPGCRFAPRCAYATEACTKGNIKLEEVSKDHFVAYLHIN